MVEGINAVAGSVVEVPDYSIPAEQPPSGELGKDAFLKLLVAQLKYQDPLEPSSSEEFIATTAQFTVVEKLDELTKQGANTALVNSLTTASALIGREVTVNRNGQPVTAVVNQSRIVSGEVSLETELGPVGLTEIVSVGAATSAATPAAIPGPSPAPVPEQAPTETSGPEAQPPAPASTTTDQPPATRAASTPAEQADVAPTPVEPTSVPNPATPAPLTATPVEPVGPAPVARPSTEQTVPALATRVAAEPPVARPLVEPAAPDDKL